MTEMPLFAHAGREKNYPAAPFCAIETNQILRLQNPNFANLRCSSAAPGFFLFLFFLLPVLIRKTRKKREDIHKFPPNFLPAKNQLTASRN